MSMLSKSAVRFIQSRIWVDRLEATIEAHVEAAAAVRERCGIPGTSVRTAYLCRDKPAMKEVLREAGVPTAQSDGADNAEQLWTFARNVGYPLIIKPRSAAGASGTVRVDNDAELEAAVPGLGFQYGNSVAVEEFIEGHEGFYDTVSIGGNVGLEFISHYYPNVLEAMRTRWISPMFIATNRIDNSPGYDEVKEMGKRVISLLGIETSATHMEWFFGPKGLKFSEIACRPPGVGAWDLYCAANDLDLYREWANAVCHGRLTAAPSRTLLRRDHRPPSRSRWHHHGIRRAQRGPFPIRGVDHRLPPPVSRHRHPTGRSGLHGQRLAPDASSRLRRTALDAGSGGGDRPGAGILTRAPMKKPGVMKDVEIADAESIDRFIAGREFPIVEPGQATFLFRGPADAVSLRPMIAGFPGTHHFSALNGHDLWWLELSLPDGARLEYKLEVQRDHHAEWVNDPAQSAHHHQSLRHQFCVPGLSATRSPTSPRVHEGTPHRDVRGSVDPVPARRGPQGGHVPAGRLRHRTPISRWCSCTTAATT